MDNANDPSSAKFFHPQFPGASGYSTTSSSGQAPHATNAGLQSTVHSLTSASTVSDRSPLASAPGFAPRGLAQTTFDPFAMNRHPPMFSQLAPHQSLYAGGSLGPFGRASSMQGTPMSPTAAQSQHQHQASGGGPSAAAAHHYPPPPLGSSHPSMMNHLMPPHAQFASHPGQPHASSMVGHPHLVGHGPPSVNTSLFTVASQVPAALLTSNNDSQDKYQKQKHAMDFLSKVRIQYHDKPNVYNEFLEIMKDFKSSMIETPEVIRRIRRLFADSTYLIQEFNAFLPPGYRIDMYPDAPEPRPPSHKGSEAKPAVDANGRHAAAAAGGAGAAAQGAAESGADLEEARHYVRRIKARFADQPGVYGRFLEILHAYYQSKLSIVEVVSEVGQLFRDHDDLLADFKNFLPSSVAASSAPAVDSAASASLASFMGKKLKKKTRPADGPEDEDERLRKEERRRLREEREREKERDRDRERKDRLQQQDEKRKKQRGLPDKIVFKEKDPRSASSAMAARDRERERRYYDWGSDDDEEHRRSARREAKERRRREEEDEIKWLPWRERKEAERSSTRFEMQPPWRERREAKEKRRRMMLLEQAADHQRDSADAAERSDGGTTHYERGGGGGDRGERGAAGGDRGERGVGGGGVGASGPLSSTGYAGGSSSAADGMPIVEDGHKYIDDAQLEEEYKRVKQEWRLARQASKEFNVFFTIKHRLKSRQAFKEFCYLFILFVQDVVTKDEFLKTARVLIGPFRDVYRRLKQFICFDAEDEADLPAKTDLNPVQDDLDVSDNDDEFDNEEFALRLRIELNQSTMRAFEAISADIATGHDPLERVNELDPLHIRNVERIYGSSAGAIIDALYDSPAAAVPVILKRLRQKNAEWLSVPPDRERILPDPAASSSRDAAGERGGKKRGAEDAVKPYLAGYGTRSVVSKRDQS